MEKEDVRKILEEKNLFSVMNNTKWIELQSAMEKDLLFPPPYTIKYLFEEEEESDLNFGNTSYLGDWSYETFGYYKLYLIQHVKIRPVYLKYQGKFIEDLVVDETQEFVNILKKLNIYYEVDNTGLYTIYGYKKTDKK